MTDTTWPETGETIDKTSLRRALKTTGLLSDYVGSGFSVSAGSGLNATIASGNAFVNGVYIARDTTTNVSLAASVTTYVYVGYVDGTANSLQTTTNTTGVSPGANYILLATVVTNGTVVTSVTDKRVLSPGGGWGG
jgi:hypothetical protein